MEKAEFLASLRAEGKAGREARLELARVRADWWPPLDVLVAGCLRQRLAEPDLAGPWEPLTEEETLGMTLSGRWPGPAPRTPVRRSYELPSSLVTELRTASWRMSEPSLLRMDRQGLLYGGHWSDSEAAERERLAQLIYSPARIVREALERYARAEGDE
ncbi:hypothetical protein ACIRPK_34075 [Kitasatospora sp. NPDC101801]|uniref:hypothetical protein n=1 Tax=Kitasatospora sp. NPDC101801 TaxID=3364103 RepID=UPI003812EBA9